ncbi:hypothetical protein [Agromyces sp. Soil535]|uniref:hypothetical protein n=1 Tax=Agromyces sp. Soil535 TaxID=1736390 RepID=UPI0006F2D0E9|nr:hypothetical protein [Agromyces sp. Soil535]KRE28235.1 hypothetical protein ASG80_21385 [Agromyces sp. Soil535]
MKLLAIPDASGKTMLWINAEHLVSVGRIELHDGREVRLIAELKVEGMPLQRIELGAYSSPQEADTPWASFLARLEA